MEEYPFVSVIVPVLNRENHIGRCLDSLLALNYPSFEIIVVDNGSTDKTQEIISRYPVKMAVEQKGGAYAARNTGIKFARGEIIAFTDSDCVVDKDWLNKLVKNYHHEGVGGVGGQLMPYPHESLTEEFLSFGVLMIFHSTETVVIQQDTNRFLSGALGSANMSYRKKVLRKMNEFEDDLANFGGDYDLCWRVQRNGYEVIYEPEAIVFHELRSNLSQMIKQFFYLGKGLPLLLKKQPGNFSYITIKTYLFHNCEFRCKLPIQMLLTLDFCNLLILGLLLIFVHPFFLYLSLVISMGVLWGSWRSTKEVVKKTRKVKWFLLFPFLHLIRNYSFTIGKLVGGVKHGIIAA